MDAPDSSDEVSGDDETQYLTPTASDPNAETFGLAPDPSLAPIGEDFRLGPYRVIRELGRGGMGIVYLAEDPELKRRVALKVLPPAFGQHSAHLARFKREAEVASKLDHPNLCGVQRVGQSEGRHWIAMRFVDGQPLDEMLRDEASMSRLSSSITSKSIGGIDVRLVARLLMIEKVGRALQVAHDAGVVHRDLKPGNIIVTESGEPVVLDFGLAIDLKDEDGPALTQSGDVLGTPYYMAPEQIRGEVKSADHRVDIWALGVMLYEVVTGQRPFSGATRDALYRSILESEPVPLRKLTLGAPKDLATIVETALAKSVDKRYATAQALADDLRALMEIRPIQARPVGVVEKTMKLARRKPALATLIVALILAVPTLGILLTNRAFDQKRIAAALTRNRATVVAEIDKGRPRGARAALVAGRTVAEDPSWEAELESRIVKLEEDEKARTILLDDDADPKGDRAVAFLKTLVDKRPGDDAPHVWLALAYAKQGQDEKAVGELGRLDQKDAYLAIFNQKQAKPDAEAPDTLLGLFEVVLLSIRERPDEALRRLEILMEAAPAEPALAWVAAEQATKIQNFRGALAYASKAKSLMSELSVLQRGRYSVHLRRAGHARLALRMAEEAYKDAPSDFLLRLHYAAALADAGKTKESVDVYQALIKDEPDSAIAHRSFVSVLFEERRFEEALPISTRAVELDGEDADVQVNHAAILQELGKLEETLAALDKALELRPRFPFALQNRANCLKDMGRYDEALLAANKALELRPIYPQVHYTIGSIYLRQNKDNEALLALENAISQKADFHEALAGAGTIHVRAQRFEKAVEFYERALAVDPTEVQTLTHLPLAYEGLGRIDDALKAGAKAMLYHPNRIQGGLNYGSAMIHAQKLDEARVLFWELFEINATEDRIGLILVTLLAEGQTELSTCHILRLEDKESPFYQHVARFLPTLVGASAAGLKDTPVARVCRLRKEMEAGGLADKGAAKVKAQLEELKKVPLGKEVESRITNIGVARCLARISGNAGLTDLEKEIRLEVKRREDAYQASAKAAAKRREEEALIERRKARAAIR